VFNSCHQTLRGVDVMRFSISGWTVELFAAW
jgi:hypothetical protein